MPNNDAITKHTGRVGIHMHHGAVLHIGAGADADAARVATQHTAVKDARIGADLNITNNGRVRGDQGAAVDARKLTFKGQDERLGNTCWNSHAVEFGMTG